MTEFLARVLAVLFAALAAAAAWGIAAHWGEPGLRSVARGLFALVLLEMAVMAWRWPARRPRRFRERVGRLLATMAETSTHADFAESTPQVSLPVAMLDDWDLAVREQRALPPGALAPAEHEALDAFGRVVDHLRPSLLAIGMKPLGELPDLEPWRLFVEAARRARDAWEAAVRRT